MLETYTKLATRFYPFRWWLGGITMMFFATAFVLMMLRSTYAVYFVGVAAGPIIAISWGLLCMCIWFHPTLGRLRTGWFINRLPRVGRSILLWYFAVFLTLWFVFGVVAWPIFAIWGGVLV
jgi:hypothetical protein